MILNGAGVEGCRSRQGALPLGQVRLSLHQVLPHGPHKTGGHPPR
jgi:hypothetical protein